VDAAAEAPDERSPAHRTRPIPQLVALEVVTVDVLGEFGPRGEAPHALVTEVAAQLEAVVGYRTIVRADDFEEG
jgi:hypothetical protein